MALSRFGIVSKFTHFGKMNANVANAATQLRILPHFRAIDKLEVIGHAESSRPFGGDSGTINDYA